MKNALVLLFTAGVMAGCGQSQEPPKPVESAKVVPVKPAKTHNYSLKDGNEYGYERAVSLDDQNKGQAANTLIMAKFAGQNDGKYQVFMKSPEDGNANIVAECTNPCEFMKVMVFYQGTHVSTERMRVAPGIIGWMILEDAINGQLQQFIGDRDGRKYTVWFDEKKGIQRTALK